MTHNDIYTKFMIEYDKANVTSSYPSLTEYEVATILDKAYYALIALKVTGNNPRRIPFEADIKSISDIQPLVVYKQLIVVSEEGVNKAYSSLPSDFLYYVLMILSQDCKTITEATEGEHAWEIINQTDGEVSPIQHTPISQDAEQAVNETVHPYDEYDVRQVPVKLTSHDVAEKFIITPYNMPWIKIPVAFMENDRIYFVYDPINKPSLEKAGLTYIKHPAVFAKNVDRIKTNLDNISVSDPEILDYIYNIVDQTKEHLSLFNGMIAAEQDVDASVKEAYNTVAGYINPLYTFELSDSMAEELISLAVMMALENVESTRLNTKLNMRGLES